MKYLAGALVALNVLVYLWAAGGAGPGAARPEAPAEVNADAMRLVHEIPPEDDAGDPAEFAAGDEPGGASEAAAIEPSGIDSRTPAAVRSCHRIGPFQGGAGWAAANRWMRAQGLDYRAIRGARRATRVVRVYLGPFESRAAAGAALAALKDANLEHFVEAGADGAAISLGYFTQAALAEKFVAHLRTRGFEARARRDYRDIGPRDWFEAAVDSADHRNRLRARRWAEPGAVVVEVDCRDLAAPAG